MVDILGPILGLVEAIPGFAGWANKRTARRVHRELAALVFWQDGMRQRLMHIAEGNGTQQDLDELALLLRTTQIDVWKADKYLKAHRRKIAEIFGVGAAQEMDYIASRKLGPKGIRLQIAWMVEKHDLSPELAQDTLALIGHFDRLVEHVSANPSLI